MLREGKDWAMGNIMGAGRGHFSAPGLYRVRDGAGAEHRYSSLPSVPWPLRRDVWGRGQAGCLSWSLGAVLRPSFTSVGPARYHLALVVGGLSAEQNLKTVGTLAEQREAFQTCCNLKQR